MGSGDNGGMIHSTDDNRPTPLAAERADEEDVATGPGDDSQATETEHIDPLDEIAAELDGLADLDPADAVPVLADITAELNRQLDADTDRS